MYLQQSNNHFVYSYTKLMSNLGDYPQTNIYFSGYSYFKDDLEVISDLDNKLISPLIGRRLIE